MDPVSTAVIVLTILSTTSIDLAFEDNILEAGFVQHEESLFILEEWKESNNGYFGNTEDGDKFYLIVTDEELKIKIWTDQKVVRLVEPLI